MFVQQLMRSNSSEQTVPASLLHKVSCSLSSLSPRTMVCTCIQLKMKYMYRREKFLLAHTTDLFSSTHIQSETVLLALHVNYLHISMWP